ncbi:MAG: HNH endonuclease [Polaromonas sp.]|nr:HNH endonuclease [Polaromonas sp.]
MAIDRLRGRALQSLRKRLLSANPLCVMCQAKTPPQASIATQLDHIKAIVSGGDARPDDDGYQGLCSDCHSKKSREDLGYKAKAEFVNGRIVW